MKGITTAARVVLPVCAWLAAGCTQFQIHDVKKSEVVSAIKAQFTAVDVLGTIATQKENLAALSAEELSAVRENAQIQRDFALLEIVDNDSPMATTWVDDIEPGIKELGFANAAALRSYVRTADAFFQVRNRELDRLAQRISEDTGRSVAACNDDFVNRPDIDWPDSLDETILDRAKARYNRYKNACQSALGEREFGALGDARAAWLAAKTVLRKGADDTSAARMKVKEAKDRHRIAVAAAEAAGTKGEDLRQAVKESADTLQGVLDQAALLAPSVVSEERIAGITALLQAAASDSVSEDQAPSENLAEAMLLVNGVTSLAGDISMLVARAEAPSISNLIIEMQHQIVLLEHAKARQSLEQERVAVLEAKYRAYQAEASELLAFHDAICSFGVLNAGSAHPGPSCDAFTAAVDDRTATCSISTVPAARCDLSKPWKDHLSRPTSGEKGRELYKSLTSLLRLFPIRASQAENNFRLIDLEHRKNLAAREMGLKAWNNLVAVPIEQLDAYYASGLKPVEIADLLVKALGLTAIAIGVSN